MSQILGPQFLVSGGLATKWSSRVFVADAYNGPWNLVPHLRPVSWTMTAAPEISKATFVYEYGNIKQAQASIFFNLAPKDLGNKFVRIELTNEYGSFIAWQGYMVDNSMDIWAESDLPQGTGVQTMQAYGLEYLLTKVKITNAIARVDASQTGADAVVIDTVPAFNQNMLRGASTLDTGNRSFSTITVDLGGGNIQTFYPFAQSDDETSVQPWLASDAVDMLLKVYGSTLGIPWAVNGQVEMIEQYEPTHSVAGMNLWEALYSLMPRQRGMTITMEHLDPPTIWLSSAFIDDITVDLSTGALVFPGNPEVYDVDFNDALDLKRTVVFMSTQDRYREVIVTGEPIRATFTGSVSEILWPDREFTRGWPFADQATYENPTPLPTPPGGAGDDWYAAARDKARSRQRFSHTWKWFVRNKNWNGMTDGVSTCPVANNDGGVDPGLAVLPVIGGKGFKRILPFLQGLDYSVWPPVAYTESDEMPDSRRSYGLILDDVSEPAVWVYLHELQSGKVPNIAMRLTDHEYGIELPNASHFLARGHWNFDPVVHRAFSNHAPVYDYDNLLFTVCWELDQRLKVVKTISGNAEDAVLHLHVPGAHCWIVHPNTIVDIGSDGTLLPYAGPYEFRNDNAILKTVAGLASGWYSTRRNLCRYQIVGLYPHIPIGAMLGVGYTGSAFAQINTPVTKKVYHFGEEPTCMVMTGYSNLDIVTAATSTLIGPVGGKQSSGAGNRSVGQQGRVPTTPSNSVLIRQGQSRKLALTREEEHTEQIVSTLTGGIGGGGGGAGEHVHSGETGDINELSWQRTKMKDDTDDAKVGTFGVHYNSGKWFSDRTLWG